MIAKITAIVVAWYTTGVAATSRLAIHHDPEQVIPEVFATEFSLLDDAGDHVLNFGAARHGRRLDSTNKIRLKFKAFGTSFEYHLYRSPSVLLPSTKIYAFNKAKGHYHKQNVTEESRSFHSPDFDAALTFLSHDKITGTVLLHNR